MNKSNHVKNESQSDLSKYHPFECTLGNENEFNRNHKSTPKLIQHKNGYKNHERTISITNENSQSNSSKSFKPL